MVSEGEVETRLDVLMDWSLKNKCGNIGAPVFPHDPVFCCAHVSRPQSGFQTHILSCDYSDSNEQHHSSYPPTSWSEASFSSLVLSLAKSSSSPHWDYVLILIPQSPCFSGRDSVNQWLFNYPTFFDPTRLSSVLLLTMCQFLILSCSVHTRRNQHLASCKM